MIYYLIKCICLNNCLSRYVSTILFMTNRYDYKYFCNFYNRYKYKYKYIYDTDFCALIDTVSTILPSSDCR